MHSSRFKHILILLTLLGLALRLYNYDVVPPFGESRDEFQYPWAGMSMIKTGVPTSWSYFESYKTHESIHLWGQEFRLVTPWFDKPPLYPLITGSLMLLLGINDYGEVTLTTLRLIPIALSFTTMILIGIIGKHFFSAKVGLLTTFLYAITPTIVMSNRLSLTENLLTPIILISLILLAKISQPTTHNLQLTTYNLLLGVIAGLALLTKQTGIAVFLAIAALLFWKRKFRSLLTITALTASFGLVYLAYIVNLDLGLYLNVMSDFRHGHALLGLPEIIPTIFRFPTISQKNRIFLDGTMLLGWVLFFTSPLWLKNLTNNNHISSKNLQPTTYNLQLLSNNLTPKTYNLFLTFPFTYLVLLTAVESGATAFSYFAWHVYPLFPFLMLALAVYLQQLWKRASLILFLPIILFMGLGALQQVFQFLPQTIHHRWQYVYLGILGIIFAGWLTKIKTIHRLLIILVLTAIASVNIYTIYHLHEFYHFVY